MAYKRWYDFDQRLSTVVRSMEFMNTDSQMRFADKLLELSEGLLMERGGQDYLMSLDNKRREGLEKSQSRKRWYDRYESLHRAFNNLYALPNEDRKELAARLHTPIQIVEGYERHCKKLDQQPDMRVIEEVLRTSFTDGEERARKLYALYMTDFSEAMEKMNQRKEESLSNRSFWSELLGNIQKALEPV